MAPADSSPGPVCPQQRKCLADETIKGGKSIYKLAPQIDPGKLLPLPLGLGHGLQSGLFLLLFGYSGRGAGVGQLRLLLSGCQPTWLSDERGQYQRQDSCLKGALFHKNLPSCRSAQSLTGRANQFHVIPQKDINAFALPGGPGIQANARAARLKPSYAVRPAIGKEAGPRDPTGQVMTNSRGRPRTISTWGGGFP
jgi:hypothetical protein